VIASVRFQRARWAGANAVPDASRVG
jgi:hypothetical protein